MSSTAHSAAPRPGGGFNAGMGQFGEHLDEAAMLKAMQAKGLQQQQSSTSLVPPPAAAHHALSQQKGPLKDPSRDVGSITDELFKYPLEDLMDGFKSIADLNMWLGIEPTPEQEQERARKEMILKRFNAMTDEEQAITKQKYQERLHRMKLEEEEKQRQKQLEAQQNQTLNMPTKAQSGPVGPGMSGSQKAKAQLDWDRQRQDSTSSAG